MGDDASRFRNRAEQCRKIAAEAGSKLWRNELLGLAKDLDDEADELDREEADQAVC